MEARVILSHKVLDPVHVQPDTRVHLQIPVASRVDLVLDVAFPSDRPSGGKIIR